MVSTVIVLVSWLFIITFYRLVKNVLKIENTETLKSLAILFIDVCIGFGVLYLSIKSIIFLIQIGN